MKLILGAFKALLIIIGYQTFANGNTLKQSTKTQVNDGGFPEESFNIDDPRDIESDGEDYWAYLNNFDSKEEMEQTKEFQELLNEHIQGMHSFSKRRKHEGTTESNYETNTVMEKPSSESSIESTMQTPSSNQTEMMLESMLVSSEIPLESKTTTDIIFQNAAVDNDGTSTISTTVSNENTLNTVEEFNLDLVSTPSEPPSSIKPFLSSSGVKMNQVEKRLSQHGFSTNSVNRVGKAHDDKGIKYSKNMNEIHSFITEVKQQTPLIVFGCIMSSIIFAALVFFAYRIMNRLNETTNVALIRHSEHPDILPPHQQYQMQKLLIKQHMQEEKVVQQKVLLQQLKSSPSHCNLTKSECKVENELPLPGAISLELQEPHAENAAVNLQLQLNSQENGNEVTDDAKVYLDSSSESTQSNSTRNDCTSESSSPSQKNNLNDGGSTSRKENSGQFNYIDIIIKNGSCLDCIEAVQKRSSENYSKDNDHTTVTYHLGDGVCNDHNHNG